MGREIETAEWRRDCVKGKGWMHDSLKGPEMRKLGTFRQTTRHQGRETRKEGKGVGGNCRSDIRGASRCNGFGF